MKRPPSLFGRIMNYFFQGLLLTAPITITFVVIIQMILWIDELIPVHLPINIPGLTSFEIPGIGIIVLFVIITVVGYFASTLVANPIFNVVEKLLGRIPFLKIIYTSMKDLVEAIMGEKKRFTKSVLVTVNQNPVIQRIGFITEENLTRLGIESNKIAVYLPFSYGFNGQLVIIDAGNITELQVSGSEMMKFIISGGVTELQSES
jgi:uncharacterized membrane protein